MQCEATPSASAHVITVLAALGSFSGLVLLAFGPPERTVADEGVRCTYPIINGFLVRRAGGTISFSQEAGPPLALASAITGFFPRFAAPPGRPGWTGALYEPVQRRLHQAVS